MIYAILDGRKSNERLRFNWGNGTKCSLSKRLLIVEVRECVLETNMDGEELLKCK